VQPYRIARIFRSPPALLPDRTFFAPAHRAVVQIAPRLATGLAACRMHHLNAPHAAPLSQSLISLNHPQRRWLHVSFLSLLDGSPAATLAASLVSFACQRLARLAARRIASSFTGRRLARGATRCIACCFGLSTSCPPYRSLSCSFLAHAGVFPAAPLAASLTSLHGLPLARGAAC
jgi:hypothetical protein